MKLPSPTEPVSDLRRVKIIECGEPLVDFLAEFPSLTLDRPRFNYRRETLLRKTVAFKLYEANEILLGKGYHIRIVEGWRAPFIQRRMYQHRWNNLAKDNPDWSEHQLKRVTNRFTAPMNVRVPPPHTTGGAIDVVLYRGDEAVDMMSPYKTLDHHGYGVSASRLSGEARRNRETMGDALLSVGITNYPSEFWHWSYGDQGWAYRGGHPNAIYGPITPPDWTPAAEDDTDEPLVFQE